MNTNNVKKYAPRARKAFIDAMSKQAAKYGITKNKIEPAEQKGDLVLIGDRPFPASIIKPRKRLEKRIEQQGFDQVMEHVAYSWFNRLCAIRYMELKGFLDHGRRVLSSVEGSAADGSAGVPQILEECLDIELPGLDQARVRELKLDGTKDEELYRELLMAQCHALHQAMPFLFEAVADESELLLPENLTKTNSLIRDLVASVPEEDWAHIEIIGWLYQYYISEKKDQVIGKVVKSEDIPAATQLFTPNWIVQYMVQNSVGRQWLQTYPDSPLKDKMSYYIEPAEQTPEVQEQLSAITPSDITPESIKVLDPACGSGHILVEAYKLLKAIYEERGYRIRDIPQLILENNLFGLDIDDRAGQLSGFALMMLAREDDRRIFSRKIRLNVLSLQESSNVNLPSLWRSLNLTGEWKSGTSQELFGEEQQDISTFAADNRYQLLQRTLERFQQAKTFGSLIETPHKDLTELENLLNTLCELEASGDSMQKSAISQLSNFLHQAIITSKKYQIVVVNPPYINSRNFEKILDDFINKNYVPCTMDLFTAFYLRSLRFLEKNGFLGFVTPFTWMYLTSYEKFRTYAANNSSIESIVKLEYNSFEAACVPVCTFICRSLKIDSFRGVLFDLDDFKGFENQPKYLKKALVNDVSYRYIFNISDYVSLPESVFALSLPERARDALSSQMTIGKFAEPKQGIKTGDNARFLRRWFEVPLNKSALSVEQHNEAKKWFPIQKGGRLRRWYGNNDFVVNWQDDGFEIKNFYNDAGRLRSRPQNLSYVFKEGLTWSTLTVADFSMRYCPPGFISESAGSMCYVKDSNLTYFLLGYFCSNAFRTVIKSMSPVLSYSEGAIARSPVLIDYVEEVSSLVAEAINISKDDWDRAETSWDFKGFISKDGDFSYLRDEYADLSEKCKKDFFRLKEIEKNIDDFFNRIFFIDDTSEYSSDEKYGASPDIKLINPNQYVRRLISYSVGILMGRYSLNKESIIFAHSDNDVYSQFIEKGFYEAFPTDDDGIVPLTNLEWYSDDATNRLGEFVKVVWGEKSLQENLDFIAESLCLESIKKKKSESSIDIIRRYLSNQFYKDHLKTYKKRPIYWLFSSGKQKAFECLVYLHRYNEGTLARMRTEYVIPLTAKMAAYAQKLENDKEASGSAAEVKRLENEISQLHKQQAELSEFDEKLRHYADQRISLDLDDGVKVNYGKFGDLLAEVKAITGEAPEVLS